MGHGSDWIEQAKGMSPGDATLTTISGILLAIGGGVILGLETLAHELSGLFTRIRALGRLIAAFFDNPVLILEAGARETAAWIVETDLGLFSFAAAVVAVAMGYWAWKAAGAPIPFFGRFVNRFRGR